MPNKSKIEWTDTTWNPIIGCDKIGDGCDNCYAENIVQRFAGKTGCFISTIKTFLIMMKSLECMKMQKNELNIMTYKICESADIAAGVARGFRLPDGRSIILWRQGERLRGFINRCPHLGTPLETFPDHFLDEARALLICSTHGAAFDENGLCVSGPCKGDRLTRVQIAETDACIFLKKR